MEGLTRWEEIELAPILEVKNLTHIYSVGTPFEHKALEEVSFAVERGEFIGIIGHTGSGKSTLMQHLNGLLKPHSGEVLLDGKDIWSDKKLTRQARFRVGLVFQYPEYQLFEETVYKDIAFGPKNMGLSAEEVDRRVREAAGFVGITDEQLNVSPFDLSGGQKRRVAIAGVIAMEPEVLILDEPTAGLDPSGREEILQNIESYRRAKNATIMMVSHSMNDVARLTDRLIVMNGSHLAMDGTPTEVFAHPQELLDMGLDIPELSRLFLLLKQNGLDLGSVYTMDQAIAALKNAKRGDKNA
jgi:energy-coupling factor transport system ATP-binding protein